MKCVRGVSRWVEVPIDADDLAATAIGVVAPAGGWSSAQPTATASTPVTSLRIRTSQLLRAARPRVGRSGDANTVLRQKLRRGAENSDVSTDSIVPARRAELRNWLRGQWPAPFRPWWTGRDVGVVYALLVLAASLVIQLAPQTKVLVEHTSTNLADMSSHPFQVLVLSAFVIAPLGGLVLLIPVVVLYGELQRWVGRLSTVLVVVFGHVGATLVVMTMEITAMRSRLVGLDIAVRPDVGVSYGMFAVVGALLARVPTRWRWPYLLACLVLLALLLITHLNFTNLGHATAWLIGISISWLLRVRPAE